MEDSIDFKIIDLITINLNSIGLGIIKNNIKLGRHPKLVLIFDISVMNIVLRNVSVHVELSGGLLTFIWDKDMPQQISEVAWL